MPVDDAWDWPTLLYVATVILKMPEAKFWRMKPRKLRALSKAHLDLNSPPSDKKDKPAGFIDQVL